jgi:hypothetical protein
LAQVERHKNNVVVRLTDLVDDAVGLLWRAGRAYVRLDLGNSQVVDVVTAVRA